MSVWYERPTIIEKIAEDQPIWFISDLHLGDGTPSDVFFGKDRHLIALVERVEREGGLLVIAGDAIDFNQAWAFVRVLRAHQELFAAMTRLGREGRLFYVIGNHDYDLSLFHELLNFRVCDELHCGRKILVRHGWQYDPFLSESVGKGHSWSTTLHHLTERYLNTWLRIPLGEFYTLPNRLLFWLLHKVALGASLYNRGARALGLPESAEGVLAYTNYWVQSNMGDPMGIFRPAWQHLRDGSWQYIVCGHSHLPGIVRTREGRAYINTGSWTFSSAQYVFWDGSDFTCRDWITNRSFDHSLYEPLLDGTLYHTDFRQWWRENYMGRLKFREGEERLLQRRGWESFIRDHQYLSGPEPTWLGKVDRLPPDEDVPPP